MKHYKRFPTQALQNFIKNPTFENLERIIWICDPGDCADTCPFGMEMCPPPYVCRETYKEFLDFKLRYNQEPLTLSEIVLMLSEVLAKHEQRRRKRGLK